MTVTNMWSHHQPISRAEGSQLPAKGQLKKVSALPVIGSVLQVLNHVPQSWPQRERREHGAVPVRLYVNRRWATSGLHTIVSRPPVEPGVLSKLKYC